jgi:hypothetical protein
MRYHAHPPTTTSLGAFAPLREVFLRALGDLRGKSFLTGCNKSLAAKRTRGCKMNPHCAAPAASHVLHYAGLAKSAWLQNPSILQHENRNPPSRLEARKFFNGLLALPSDRPFSRSASERRAGSSAHSRPASARYFATLCKRPPHECTSWRCWRGALSRCRVWCSECELFRPRIVNLLAHRVRSRACGVAKPVEWSRGRQIVTKALASGLLENGPSNLQREFCR